MELPHLGKNCQYLDCNQLDFLPSHCKFCDLIFCEEHRLRIEHDCKALQNDEEDEITTTTNKMLMKNDDVKCVICPVCKKSIKFIKNEDINVTVERHMQSEQECSRTKNVVNRCPVKGCREILHIVNEFVCSSCKQKVCLKHRFERDHDCDRIYRSQLIPLGKPKSQILSSMIKKTATTTQKQQKMKLQQLAESCVRCGKLFPHRAARLAHRCSSSNNNAADTTTKSSCCVN